MATRQYRLSEFDQGAPPTNRPLELLCEDKSGTYLLLPLERWRVAQLGDRRSDRSERYRVACCAASQREER
jgi:hypothetical protein